MNILGINIQRSTTLAATVAALTAPAPADTDPNELESVKFGKAYAKGTSREMLDTLAANSKAAETYTKVALYLSIPHQALYLLSQVELRHTAPIEWAETGIAFAMALVLPFLVDQLILMNIRTIAARAAAAAGKWRAGGILGVAIPASMYVNFAAPGPLVLRCGAASLVLLVGLYQIARLCRVDFAKVGETERALNAEVASIQAGGPQSTQPARSTKTRKDLDRRKAAAVAFAIANPNVTAGQLAKQSNIGRETAKKILADLCSVQNVDTAQDLLDAAGPVDDAPVSGAPAGAKA